MRLVVVVRRPSGAFVKLNADGTGTIVTGALECGTGAVMALPLLASEVLGMRPEDFSILAQDTDAGPWDMGASGSQTTFNNGRSVVAAAIEVRDQLLDLAAEELEAGRGDLELVDGVVRVKGSPDRAKPIAQLAGAGIIVGKGSGDVPRASEAADAGGCVGLLGQESFLAPQLVTHAARVKVDRETGVVRVLAYAAAHDSGAIINRPGADGQVYGGVVMGIGQALTEGIQLTDDGRQRNPDPARLQARDRRRRAHDRHPLGRNRDVERRPARRERSRRTAMHSCRRRDRERHRERHRESGQAASDDRGARLERHAGRRYGLSSYHNSTKPFL